jgi:hypothetical protein
VTKKSGLSTAIHRFFCRYAPPRRVLKVQQSAGKLNRRSPPPLALDRRHLLQLRIEVGPLAAHLSVLGARQ